jgi:hypothetical protein
VHAIPCFFVRAIAQAALSQSFYFGGKEESGDGTPGGLPLICRFSDATGVFGSISRWRTHILVILQPEVALRSQDHALSFPGKIVGAPPFMAG